MSVPLHQLDGADPAIPQEQISHDEILILYAGLRRYPGILVLLQQWNAHRSMTPQHQIEKCLFKIPRSPLVKQSFTFQKWSGDERSPLVVHDVTAHEFRHFLQILLPGFTTDPLDFWSDGHPPSEEEWISVLKLSTKWFCLNMRLVAIQKLNAMPPAKSIVLGRKYHIRGWVISGYKNLLTRHDGVSDVEATYIGLRESLRIMRMREVPYSSVCDVEIVIEKLFEDELASIKAASKSFYFCAIPYNHQRNLLASLGHPEIRNDGGSDWREIDENHTC